MLAACRRHARRRAGGVQMDRFENRFQPVNAVYSDGIGCIVPVMQATANTPTATAFESMINQIIEQVVSRIDYTQLTEQKFAYTPDEVAKLVGFTSGRAVKAEANAGRLIGTKVCGQWRFTPDQIRDYLRENEVTT